MRYKRWYVKDKSKKHKNLPNSFEMKDDWILEIEIPFIEISKLKGSLPQETVLKKCGFIQEFNNNFERIKVQSKVSLNTKLKRLHFKHTTTSQDPVMRQIAKELNAKDVVFTTDRILSAVMASTKSYYAWDIVIENINGIIFMDTRKNSPLNKETVNETADVQPPIDDSINSINATSFESNKVSEWFKEQTVLKRKAHHFKEVHPKLFPSKSDKESKTHFNNVKLDATGYIYKKWSLSDNLSFISRSEIDSMVPAKYTASHNDEYISIKCLNEFPDEGASWRKVLSQSQPLLIKEFPKNSFKMARWIIESVMSGVDQMKVGFVSRKAKSSRTKGHQILKLQSCEPLQYLHQINFRRRNAWAIVEKIIKKVKQLGNGKYLLARESDIESLKLYSIPKNSVIEDPKVNQK